MDILGYQFPEELLYDKEHGWAKEEGDLIIAGVTDYFQKLAGEIIFIEMPLVGRKVEKGQPYSSIESGKWVGRLKAPVSGEIVEVNSELTDFPYLLNESSYEEGWIIKIKPSDAEEIKDLLSPGDEYTAYIEEEDRKIKEGTKK
ncbi:MAG: glycine cleavage system protein H [Firmicutes bacterium HGW-Firmicutes-12]|jgi:glycine cleavage system H protein|nr:MAG: glycine cleavage system protein H [Firmicutes bacterium HGW-Firmicutes-12]